MTRGYQRRATFKVVYFRLGEMTRGHQMRALRPEFLPGIAEVFRGALNKSFHSLCFSCVGVELPFGSPNTGH